MRAKFKCESIVVFENVKSAKLRAVTGLTEKDFAKWTPAGYLEITIDNEAPANNFFSPGKSYFIDFTEEIKNIDEFTN